MIWTCKLQEMHNEIFLLDKEATKGSKYNICLARDISPILGDPDWQHVTSWIERCDLYHAPECKPLEPIVIAGLEVIDCDTHELVVAPLDCRYAALSYVWGDPSNHEDRPLKEALLLSGTIRDVATCTRRIGIRYLWIDRYCIDQTSETKDHLIQNMDKIYSYAAVVIINAAGEGSEAGLPGISPYSRPQPTTISLHGIKVSRIPNARLDIARSKWATRGWTFQEGLLTRRRLVFTRSQLYFQCMMCHHCEATAEVSYISNFGGAFSSKTQAISKSLISSSISTLAELCAEFSERTLKYEDDALDACLGIFSQFWNRDSPVFHYWGLPFVEATDVGLVSSLLWSFEYNITERKHERRRTILPVQPRSKLEITSQVLQSMDRSPGQISTLPSWSWVAWKGGRLFREKELKNRNLSNIPVRIHVKDRKGGLHSIPQYINIIGQYGKIHDFLPRIKLTGWVSRVWIQPNWRTESHRCFTSQDTTQDCVSIANLMFNTISEGSCVVLHVATTDRTNGHFLVLRHASHPVETDDYERIGTCEITGSFSSYKEDHHDPYVLVQGRRDFRWAPKSQGNTYWLAREQRTIWLV